MNKRAKVEQTTSYMQMGLNLDGHDPLFLQIPTYWDAVEKQWIGMIQTPITKKMIYSTGKNSFELQNNFNIEMSKLMNDENYAEEIVGMFRKAE